MKRAVYAAIVIIVALSIIFFATACQQRTEKTENIETTKLSVRLKWAMLAHVASGELIAKEKGFYKKEGLEVDLRPGGLEFDAIKTVSIGADDIGVTSPDQVILINTKGAHISAFMVIMQKDPVCLIAKKESNILEPKDFIGKKVGVKHGTSVETEYRAMLNNLGINSNLIQEIPAKFDMTPFFTDKVDVWPGYAVNEAILAKLKGFEVNLIKPSDYGVQWYGNMYFATQKYIKEHTDVLEKFVRATTKGWIYALEHQDEAVDILLKYNPNADPTHQKKILKVLKEYLITDATDKNGFGWMEANKWNSIQDVLFEQGLINKKTNIESLYTNQFIHR